MSKRIPIFLGIILVIIAVWILITPHRSTRLLIERLDNLGYDLQIRTRILKGGGPKAPVAIIDIDDKSLAAEGRWPWSRSKLALLVAELQKQGAAVIAFDMFFAEKEPNIAETLSTELNKQQRLNFTLLQELKKAQTHFNEDERFAKQLAATQSLLAIGFLPRTQTLNVLPPPLLTLTPQEQEELSLIRSKGYISNIPILQQAAKGGGFINIFADNDGIIRRTPLIMQYGNNVYPALALQAVMLFLGEKVSLITPSYSGTKKIEGIALGNRIIPTDVYGQVLIPFVGRSYTFPYYSATDVLHGHLPPNALLGRILFIGTSATGMGDLQAASIQNPFPGVEVQATLVNGILLNNFSYKPAWTMGANIFLTILFGLIAAFLFPYLGPRTLGLIIILLPPALLFLNNWIWDATGLILSFLIPVLLVLVSAIVNMLYGYLFESRRREQLKNMFGQYVPAKHIDEMLKTNSDYGLRGEDREMSVLFADIRNFTTLSEEMPAADLVDMLNAFLTPMTEIIFKHRGTIDKYVGDLIMAFWGAPLKDRQHARHAITAALEMQKKVKDLQAAFAARQWPSIKIGIGINSGMMSVGDMGSRYRRNYTVLGDAVNLASRIESLTKFYGVEVIVTEFSYQHQTRFVFRQLDRVRVKGRQHAIAIYEVIGTEHVLTPGLKQELADYHQSLEFYYQQKWEDAWQGMEALQKQHPETRLYQLYLERIQEFKLNPPPADWDGVYVHISK